jgi:AcrR family transcriptional regulator
MSPRPDVSEERRTQILEAAIAVFARQGFDQARMDDIAREVGLSKGALYLYYKSKDAIISAILQFFFSRAMKKLQGFLESKEQPSVREQLLRLNQYYIAEMKWMVSLLLLSFEFYAVAAHQKTVRQFLKRYFKDYREVLAALIQRGIDRDEFQPVPAERKRLLKAFGSFPAGYTHDDLERLLDLLYGMFSDVYTLTELRQIVVSDPFDRSEHPRQLRLVELTDWLEALVA